MTNDNEHTGWKELLIIAAVITLAVLELTGTINVGWGWVLAPLWGYVLILIIFHGVLDMYDSVTGFFNERTKKKGAREGLTLSDAAGSIYTSKTTTSLFDKPVKDKDKED